MLSSTPRHLFAILLAGVLLALAACMGNAHHSADGEGEPVHMIVKVTAGTDPAGTQTLARISEAIDRTVAYARALGGERTHLLRVIQHNGDDPAELARTLATLEFIEYAEPDRRRYPQTD